MGYLIALVIAFAAADWLRLSMSLTWPQFGILAIGIPIVLWLTYKVFTYRRTKPADAATWTITATVEEGSEAAPPRQRAPRAVPENVIIRAVPKAPLLIRYRDTKGDVTEREILPGSLHRTLGTGGTLIRPRLVAYCKDRKATRTFIVGRIVWAANAETGELIDSIESYLGVDRA